MSLVSVLTAANTVPSTRSLDSTRPITADDLKPADCAGITLTDVVTGSGTFNGTGRNDLLLGSPANDTISAKHGNDCVLGGGGDDSIDGEKGTDVCIGGPGTDTFANCETAIQWRQRIFDPQTQRTNSGVGRGGRQPILVNGRVQL